jgi:hypothetical protein
MSIDLQKIRHWKVLTYLTVEILIEDKFYAKTPELGDIRSFPPSSLSKFKILHILKERNTIEEIDEESLKENTELPKKEEV